MSTNEKLAPGLVLGRYELLLPIAQGGMATVWAARLKGSRGFSKTVAVKTMLPNLSEDPMFEKMFLDEAALASRIHHPNVAEILDLGEQDDILYLVMEWVDGEALSVIHKAVRKNTATLPIRIALKIAVQACQGLHAAHELKDDNDIPLELVHRDVSPQNVLVTYDGIVKLVDFGVAKATGRANTETNAGQLKGKVPYMSPEQARGGKVDRRTDVFAMGIVLYKLTTGIHPFLGENDLVTMRNIISRPLLPPRVKMPSFPAEMEQVLMKCLHKDPEKRYQSMLELGVALERALAALGVSDDDVGAFVRLTLGDRGAKRRAALRDAARAADERVATGKDMPAPTAGPQQHENVSEIVLTAMSSGVHIEELLPDVPPRPSQPTSPTSPATPTSLASSTQPVAEPELPVSLPMRKSRGGLVAALAVIVGLGIFGVLKLASGRIGSPHAVAQGAGVDVPASTQRAPVPAAKPDPAPTPSAVEVATAAPVTSGLDPSELPSNDDDKKRAGRLPGKTASTAAPPDAKSATPVAPRSTSTAWAPTLQNPGF